MWWVRCLGGLTYFEEGTDDGEDHDGEDADDDAEKGGC